MIKLKQVETLLKKRKTIITMYANGSQWLSDGSAFYPVSGLPKLDEDNIFAIFDVPFEKREGFYFSEIDPPPLNFEDNDSAELLAGKSETLIVLGGRVLCPVSTSQGLAFLDIKYMRPFYDPSGEGFDVYERTDEKGQIYFAVKSGFLLHGLILPVKVDYTPFIETLSRWQRMSLLAQSNQAERQQQEWYQAGLLEMEKEKDKDE